MTVSKCKKRKEKEKQIRPVCLRPGQCCPSLLPKLPKNKFEKNLSKMVKEDWGAGLESKG